MATIHKNPILFWYLFTKGSNIILAPSINKKLKNKKKNYWANNYSTKAQILFGKRIIFKAQNYFLAKTYFDILNFLTHGKHKLLMTYYPYFKTISSKKNGNYPFFFFFKRNSNYIKTHLYYPWQKFSFCRNE